MLALTDALGPAYASENGAATKVSPCGQVAVIQGSWISDREKSMDFNRRKAQLSPEGFSFLESLFGYLTLDIDDVKFRSSMPNIEVNSKGGKTPFAGYDSVGPYEILHKDAESIVVRQSEGGRQKVLTFYFESPDTMWVYSGGRPSDPAGGSHLREYFKRKAPETCAAQEAGDARDP